MHINWKLEAEHAHMLTISTDGVELVSFVDIYLLSRLGAEAD